MKGTCNDDLRLVNCNTHSAGIIDGVARKPPDFFAILDLPCLCWLGTSRFHTSGRPEAPRQERKAKRAPKARDNKDPPTTAAVNNCQEPGRESGFVAASVLLSITQHGQEECSSCN